MLRKPVFAVICRAAISLAFLVALGHAHAQSERRVVSERSICRMETGEFAPDGKRRHAFVSRATLKPEENEEEILFEVALKMRNLPELQNRTGKGKPLSHQEMLEKHLPLEADYQAVADWLAAQGFTIVSQDAGHLAVFARGKVRQIQQVMQMNFARVTSEGKEYTSAVTPPTLPEKIDSLIVGINGLQQHMQAHKHSRLMEQAQPNSLTGTNPPYLPKQISKAYGADTLYGAGVSGSGQTIAIVIDTFPNTSDLTSFWSTCGIAQSLNNISFITVYLTPGAATGEETLDVEWASSISPAAKVRVYGTANLLFANIDLGYQKVYNDVITHPEYGIRQMSMSFGFGEQNSSSTLAQAQTDAQYFASLTNAGVTLFASSGDGGYNPDPNNKGQPGGATVTVQSPASDVNVAGVGGTTLTLDANGYVSAETAWAASGGGLSVCFSRPSWQTGVGLPSGTMRAVPDVSAPGSADTPAFMILNGAQYNVWGTSWSSPTWAGFCALLNQGRANVYLPSLGLLGPHIYPLLGTSNFRDITSGNNGYPAGLGYDLVTGIGVPNMQTLSQTLVGVQTTPLSQNIAPGGTALFTVAGTQPPNGAYRWQRMPAGSSTWSDLTDNATYAGSATATLTVSAVTSAMNGDQFQCIVTVNGSDTTSAPTSALIVDPPLTTALLAGTTSTSGSANGTGSSALFKNPRGITIDSSGNLFVTDSGNHTIRKITPQGMVTTLCGKPGVPGTTNATGTAALFNNPTGIAIDSSNNLYVADTGNHTIRKITSGASSPLSQERLEAPVPETQREPARLSRAPRASS